MKTASYGNLLGLFGALGLTVITRFTAIGESQLTAAHYWFAVVGGIVFIFIGFRFSTLPKWSKAIYFVLQLIVVYLCIRNANSIHETMFVLALVSLMFLVIPVLGWMNMHIMGSSTKRVTK